MILSWNLVLILFICCLIIGGVIVIGIAMLPVDERAVCGPLINQTRTQVQFYCICSQEIEWPFKNPQGE